MAMTVKCIAVRRCHFPSRPGSVRAAIVLGNEMRHATILAAVSAIVLNLIGIWPVTMSHAAVGPFDDGTWSVSLTCPDEPGGARHYTYEFSAQVAGGTFRGEHGAPGAPGWLLLEGPIQSDGTAALNAKGLTGQPLQTLYGLAGGTPYAYRMNARFAGGRGTASRVEGRPCTAAFTRQ
jgi:hypothetical protein